VEVAVPDVLVVEDDAAIRTLLTLVIEGMGHDVRSVDNAEDALLQSMEHRPDLLVLDIGLPGRNGDELLTLLLRGLGPPRSLLIVSALPAADVRAVAMQHGAGWLTKPFELEPLEAAVTSALMGIEEDDRNGMREDLGRAVADRLRAAMLGGDEPTGGLDDDGRDDGDDGDDGDGWDRAGGVGQ
jgi:DNA-binding response OmpR family regulator